MHRFLRYDPDSRATLIGILAGASYGILARLAVAMQTFGDSFVVMSAAFLIIVPIALGFLTVAPAAQPTWRYRIVAPWLPMLGTILAATVFGWEGSICVYLSVPLLFPLSSIGGALGGYAAARRRSLQAAVALLPVALGPVERRISAADRWEETTSEVRIAAPPAAVWPLIASVDSIRPEEQRPALFTRLGFPRPVSATITGTGIGAVRRARFERGVVFTETVTEWAPGRRLAFTIDPNTADIPPSSLDPHVTIGGPYFDVLTGTYELQPLDGGRATRLVLRSAHRVSTHFNLYAGWWADRIMTSIQSNILAVHKARAERRTGRAT